LRGRAGKQLRCGPGDPWPRIEAADLADARRCPGAYGRASRPAHAMIRHPLLFMLLMVGLAVTPPAHAQPAPNLLVNGDAEAAAGSATGGSVPIPGWTSVHGATAVQYGAPDFPDSGSPGPLERGVNFFAGGPNEES